MALATTTPATVGIGERRLGAGHRSAEARRQLLGGRSDRIDHVLQPQRRVRGGVGGVDLADAAGAEEGERRCGHQTSASLTGAPLATDRAAASARASAPTLAA